jgi:hypothetical protein
MTGDRIEGMSSPSVLPRPRDLAVDLGTALLVLALSVGVAVLALTTADGATRLDDITYRTEFISAWWWLACLLVPIPVLTARRRPRAALLQTVALVVPQFVAAGVCVSRYRSSGWSDGLEVFAFLLPIALTALTAWLVTLLRRR